MSNKHPRETNKHRPLRWGSKTRGMRRQQPLSWSNHKTARKLRARASKRMTEDQQQSLLKLTKILEELSNEVGFLLCSENSLTQQNEKPGEERNHKTQRTRVPSFISLISTIDESSHPIKSCGPGWSKDLAAGQCNNEEFDLKKCREPGCEKRFKRLCDLTKHEKTHSRPWKCRVSTCKYHEYGLPTQAEMARHYNDKHLASPSMFKCLFKPCSYESKRESNCKQHMEKAHGWKYVRQKTNRNTSVVL